MVRQDDEFHLICLPHNKNSRAHTSIGTNSMFWDELELVGIYPCPHSFLIKTSTLSSRTKRRRKVMVLTSISVPCIHPPSYVLPESAYLGTLLHVRVYVGSGHTQVYLSPLYTVRSHKIVAVERRFHRHSHEMRKTRREKQRTAQSHRTSPPMQ